MPRRFKFERVRTLWTEKVGTWLAIDLEQWEYDHTALTELGWSVVCWEADERVEECGHWIVKENMQYQNHNYVKGNRDVRRRPHRIRVAEVGCYGSTMTLALARSSSSQT